MVKWEYFLNVFRIRKFDGNDFYEAIKLNLFKQIGYSCVKIIDI